MGGESLLPMLWAEIVIGIVYSYANVGNLLVASSLYKGA